MDNSGHRPDKHRFPFPLKETVVTFTLSIQFNNMHVYIRKALSLVSVQQREREGERESNSVSKVSKSTKFFKINSLIITEIF